MSVEALTLTADERQAILKLWPSEEEFITWQRATLAAEIERRAAIKASADAQATVADAVQAVRDEFPTVFGE